MKNFTILHMGDIFSLQVFNRGIWVIGISKVLVHLFLVRGKGYSVPRNSTLFSRLLLLAGVTKYVGDGVKYREEEKREVRRGEGGANGLKRGDFSENQENCIY